ncbi:hypothetical protein CRE_03343 [Caenorhabditis remanei]|uniref:Uncharacterized protein n=1 Tax=Caenorhabditis remanei TaxID=31234 RepID=E3MYK9_CAERE|nr:hypothetical protein CRE_03343 [Caenorhabditis remanei]
MFFKVVFAVVFCFVLTSALPIIVGFGESLPSVVINTVKKTTVYPFDLPAEPIFIPKADLRTFPKLPDFIHEIA